MPRFNFRETNVRLVAAPKTSISVMAPAPQTNRGFRSTSVKEEAQAAQLIRFESFEVNLRSGELWKSGEKVKLPEQSFQILTMLLGRPGEVVLRREIQKRLWPNDTVVEFEHSINSAIKRLRLALGDSADQPRYVETLARRGYRWMVPVEWVEANSAGLRAPAPAALSPQPASAAAALIGKKVSHYRVLEILGGGGMGVVYRAEDLKLGRRVALKFLPEELRSDPVALERFEREARAASALEHPNICPVYEFGEHEGQPFIVMQLLSGQTLRDRLENSKFAPALRVPLPISELLDLAIQIADGLDAAHAKRIIHRDIKPANIFITTRGEAKILDFGLAKLSPTNGPRPLGGEGGEQSEPGEGVSPHDTPTPSVQEPHLTKSGVAMGTASYMSPEQVRGEKVDARTDLFSFGLVLYEMATGHQAFGGETTAVVRQAILNGTPTPARVLNPEVRSELERIIDRALEKEREKRYQAASELCTDLQALKQEAEAEGRPARGQWPFRLAAILAMLVVGAAVAWFAIQRTPPLPSQRALTRLTFDAGLQFGVTWSPDGRFIAYSSDRGGKFDIWVQQVGGTSPVKVTSRPGHNWQPDWSPDGKWIAFRSEGEGGGLFVVPSLGGPERRIASFGYGPRWSPDGSQILLRSTYVRWLWNRLFVVGLDGSPPREVLTGSSGSLGCGADRSHGTPTASGSPLGDRTETAALTSGPYR